MWSISARANHSWYWEWLAGTGYAWLQALGGQPLWVWPWCPQGFHSTRATIPRPDGRSGDTETLHSCSFKSLQTLLGSWPGKINIEQSYMLHITIFRRAHLAQTARKNLNRVRHEYIYRWLVETAHTPLLVGISRCNAICRNCYHNLVCCLQWTCCSTHFESYAPAPNQSHTDVITPQSTIKHIPTQTFTLSRPRTQPDKTIQRTTLSDPGDCRYRHQSNHTTFTRPWSVHYLQW